VITPCCWLSAAGLLSLSWLTRKGVRDARVADGVDRVGDRRPIGRRAFDLRLERREERSQGGRKEAGDHFSSAGPRAFSCSSPTIHLTDFRSRLVWERKREEPAPLPTEQFSRPPSTATNPGSTPTGPGFSFARPHVRVYAGETRLQRRRKDATAGHRRLSFQPGISHVSQ
jgi:hypothetical protein